MFVMGLFLLPVLVMAVSELELQRSQLTVNMWQQQAYKTQITLLQERLVGLKTTEKNLRAVINKLAIAEKTKAKAKEIAIKKVKEMKEAKEAAEKVAAEKAKKEAAEKAKEPITE